MESVIGHVGKFDGGDHGINRMPGEYDNRVAISINATSEEIRAAYAMAEALQTTVVFIMEEAHE